MVIIQPAAWNWTIVEDFLLKLTKFNTRYFLWLVIYFNACVGYGITKESKISISEMRRYSCKGNVLKFLPESQMPQNVQQLLQ